MPKQANAPRFLVTGKDVMQIFGCSRSYAYQSIRKLREQMKSMKIPGTDRYYQLPKEGTIQLSFFCEAYGLDKSDVAKILN